MTFGPEVAVDATARRSPASTDGRYLRITARFTRGHDGRVAGPVRPDRRPCRRSSQRRSPTSGGSSTSTGRRSSCRRRHRRRRRSSRPTTASYTFELTVTDSAGPDRHRRGHRARSTNLDPAVEAEVGVGLRPRRHARQRLVHRPGLARHPLRDVRLGRRHARRGRGRHGPGDGLGDVLRLARVRDRAGSFHVTVTLTDDDGGSDDGRPRPGQRRRAGRRLGQQPRRGEDVRVDRQRRLDHRPGPLQQRGQDRRHPAEVDHRPDRVRRRRSQVQGPHTVTPVQSNVQTDSGRTTTWPTTPRAGPSRPGRAPPTSTTPPSASSGPVGRRQHDPARRRPLRALLGQAQRLVDRGPGHAGRRPARSSCPGPGRRSSRTTTACCCSRARSANEGDQRLRLELEVPRRPLRAVRRGQPVGQQQQVLLRRSTATRSACPGSEPDACAAPTAAGRTRPISGPLLVPGLELSLAADPRGDAARRRHRLRPRGLATTDSLLIVPGPARARERRHRRRRP